MASKQDIGKTKYLASELRYYGRCEIVEREANGNYIVQSAKHGRGRAAPDQLFDSAPEAKANVRSFNRGGWADAAQLSRAL